MKIKDIRLIHQGEYLSYYEIDYINRDGNIKTYEMVSKTGSRYNNSSELSPISLGSPIPARSVVLCVFDEDHSHMLVAKEFRLGVNRFIYNNVAGLIEEGESYIDAATRELKEETGLDLTKVIDVLLPSYTSAPITDDSSIVIICEASGIIDSHNSNLSPDEEIIPMWIDRDTMSKMLHTGDIMFSARMQAYSYFWCNKI